MAVYVIQAEGTDRYKIGYASCVKRRIGHLKTSCPYPIRTVVVFDDGTMEDERALHGVFKEYRVHGEWFCLSDKTIEWMKQGKLSDYTKIIVAEFLLSKDLSGHLPKSKVDDYRKKMTEVLNGFGR